VSWDEALNFIVKGLLLFLSDLMEAARRCAPSAAQLVPLEHEGRGGKRRHGVSPKGRLLHGLFETYEALLLRHPEIHQSRNQAPKHDKRTRAGRGAQRAVRARDPRLACDESLREFVRTALALAASSAPPFIASDGVQYQLADKACGPDLSKHSQTSD